MPVPAIESVRVQSDRSAPEPDLPTAPIFARPLAISFSLYLTFNSEMQHFVHANRVFELRCRFWPACATNCSCWLGGKDMVCGSGSRGFDRRRISGTDRVS